MTLEHIQGETMHHRKGAIRNTFRYGIDYIAFDPQHLPQTPRLFSWNRLNLASFWEQDHGTKRGSVSGVEFIKKCFADKGINEAYNILLVAQPRLLNNVFNPVSFWFAMKGDHILAFIAEVNNTFHERHFYICAHSDFAPIMPGDTMKAEKIFYVSPFQEIAGVYTFKVDMSSENVSIRIELNDGENGVIATLDGKRRPMTSMSILAAAIKRPFGGIRTLSLIYWQAIKLKIKGARFLSRPEEPENEVSYQ